jgi:hypothetical protein
MLEGKSGIHRPSGCQLSVRDFVERFSSWVIEDILGLVAPRVVFAKNTAPPIIATNPKEEGIAIDWRAFCGRYQALG